MLSLGIAQLHKLAWARALHCYAASHTGSRPTRAHIQFYSLALARPEVEWAVRLVMEAWKSNLFLAKIIIIQDGEMCAKWKTARYLPWNAYLSFMLRVRFFPLQVIPLDYLFPYRRPFQAHLRRRITISGLAKEINVQAPKHHAAADSDT